MEENKFYLIDREEKQVNREEFEEFLKQYPRPLERNVCAICDPPSVTYNDFKLANRWPYSVVARTWLYDNNPGDYFYEPEEKRRYFICINHEDVFNSKTGYIEQDLRGLI